MSIKEFQKQARTLVAKSKDLKTKLTYQQALELVASLNGFKTWVALNKTYEKNLEKENIELENKKKDLFSYYRLDYFAHVKDSGSFYILVNKEHFYKFKNEFTEKQGFLFDHDDLIVEYAVHTKQLDESDSGYIVEVEEIERVDFDERIIEKVGPTLK